MSATCSLFPPTTCGPLAFLPINPLNGIRKEGSLEGVSHEGGAPMKGLVPLKKRCWERLRAGGEEDNMG